MYTTYYLKHDLVRKKDGVLDCQYMISEVIASQDD